MHIGMKEAVADRLAQERLDDGAGKARPVVTGRIDAIQPVQRDTVDPLGREDVALGDVPVRTGDPEARVFGGVFRQFRQGGGLEPEVDLERARVSTITRGRRRRASGSVRSASLAAKRIACRSFWNRSRTPGRTTFTAIVRPSRSTARCTWAMEAAATGSLKLTKSSATVCPVASSIIRAASSRGKGGMRS
jgi:hypothetical protein